MKTILKLMVIAIAGLVMHPAQAQQEEFKTLPSLVWPKLLDIRYEIRQDEYGDFEAPIFGEKTKALSGKEIYLPGYIVPYEGGFAETHFILSALPLNACFFCGTGGPETVIEVYTKKPVRYTDKPVEVKGKLRLNETDINHMIYILEDAEVLGEFDPEKGF